MDAGSAPTIEPKFQTSATTYLGRNLPGRELKRGAKPKPLVQHLPLVRRDQRDMGDAGRDALRTHRADFIGIPATGQAVVISSLNLFRFQGDRIAEHWVEYDTYGFLQQLGAAPVPAQAA